MNRDDTIGNFVMNKEIPASYREEILEVLACYPELADTRIRFILKEKHMVPYGTVPSFGSVFKKR